MFSDDLKRYGFKSFNFYVFLKIFFIFPIPGLKFIIVFRCLQNYRNKNKFLFFFFLFFYRYYKIKYSIDISFRAKIGRGLYIGHFGNIVIHGDSVLGDFCNLSQGVTIGVINHGKNKGVPTIGNSVFLGPGACVLGKIYISDYVTIGANSVINFNVPEKSTVLPSPSFIVNKDLSKFYIHNVS